jgi:hemerythrin-like metal-binding protein
MPITWKDEYSLGIDIIDNQHREFVRILGDLNTAMHKPGNTAIALEAALSDLENYLAYHAKTEEGFFDKFNYEKAVEHKAEHTRLAEYVGKIREELLVNKHMETAMQLVDFLEDWLIEHEQGIDREYVECFKKNGL